MIVLDVVTLLRVKVRDCARVHVTPTIFVIGKAFVTNFDFPRTREDPFTMLLDPLTIMILDFENSTRILLLDDAFVAIATFVVFDILRNVSHAFIEQSLRWRRLYWVILLKYLIYFLPLPITIVVRD